MSIYKKNYQNQVYDLIQKDILEQKLKLGEQINPKKIAEQHGISVMPVRDALLQLVSQGLVISKERVGFFVRQFSKKEVVDIMEVRKLFELYALRMSFERINRDEIKEIHSLIISGEKMSKDEFNELDVRLHDSFILASGNDFLISQYEGVRNLFKLFLYLDDTQNQVANEDHKRIVTAILNNDLDEALKQLEMHLNRVKDILITRF
jgi:DNA-binding GntR family transcriptional regulator